MDINVNSAFEMLKSALALFRDAISVAKGAKDLLPSGNEKDTVEKTLEAAERASKLAEAQIAQALGYHLCQCTFPPQIMLSDGYHNHQEQFKCPDCKRAWPPPEIPIEYSNHGAP